MECPRCGQGVETVDWFCPQCAEPLQTEDDIQAVLAAQALRDDLPADDTIVDGDDTVETTDSSGDALILGDLPDDTRDVLEVDTFAGVVTDGDGRTSSYLLYTNQASTRALRPDAVPERTAIAPEGRLTPLEHHLYRHIDGRRSLRELRETAQVADREITIAFLVLMDRGLVRFAPTPGEEARAERKQGPGEARALADDLFLPEPEAAPLDPPVLDASLLEEVEPTPPPTASTRRPDKALRLYAAALKDKNAGNLASARASLELALALDPELVEAQTLQLQLQHAVGPAELPPEPEDPEARRLYHEAGAKEAAGDTDGAIERLERALGLCEAPMILNRLGVILALRRRRLDEARRLLERAVELAPENRAYVHNLGKVLDFLAKEAPASRPARRSLWRRLTRREP